MTSTVTFVVPCYNYGRYVNQAVDSLLDQTYRALNIVVIDDASDDDTPDALRRYRDDPRVEVIRHETNVGHIRSYNEGLQRATGDYIGLLSADDLAASRTSVERQVEMLDAHPAVAVAHSAYQLIRADGTPFEVTRPYPHDEQAPGLARFRSLLFENTVPNSGTLVRRTCHEALGWYDAAFPHACDWDLWLRLATRYDFAYIAEPLYAYRIHNANMSIATIRPRQAVDELLRVLDKNFALLAEQDRPGLSPLLKQARRHALYYTAWGDLGYGRARRAWLGLLPLGLTAPPVLLDRAYYAALMRATYLTLFGRARYRRRFGGFAT